MQESAWTRVRNEPLERITELDVVDSETAAMLAFVACEECGDIGEVIDMCHHLDGSWLCVHCDFHLSDDN